MRFFYLFLSIWCFGTCLTFAQSADFAVEVGAFAEKVPLSYFKISGVYETFDQNQIYRYYIDAPDKNSAENLRQKAIAAGHPHARVLDFNYIKEQCDIQCSYTVPARTSLLTSSGESPRPVANPQPATTDPKSGNPLRITDADTYTWSKKPKTAADTTTAPLVPTDLTEAQRIAQYIFFDFGSHALRPESVDELNKLFDILTTFDDWRVELGAHTDARGSASFNKRLSMRRANSARKYLIYKGIPSSRVSMHYYGKTQPIARNEMPDGNDCEAGRQLNRRVEFSVMNPAGDKMDVILYFFIPEDIRY